MKAILKKKNMAATLTCYAEFELEETRPDFTPGQYFFITLKPADEEHKEDLTHHFSIVNSPNQKNTLSLTTRLRLEQSLFKRTLNEAKVGDAVEIGKIAGSFVLPEATDHPIVFIALGIGITPYMSMLRYAFEKGQKYDFTLIYSDNETASMPFLNELKQMEANNDNLKFIPVVTKDENWQGEKRHIDADFLKDYFEDIAANLYFVSGPPPAVKAVAENLKSAGIAEENIKTDSFSGY